MKKTSLFVAMLTLLSIFFSSCNVNSSDRSDDLATRQGFYMFQYWNNGLQDITFNYLDIAYRLNNCLATGVSNIEQSYSIQDAGNGVYQIYQGGKLKYEISTGGQQLTDENAHWTIEMKKEMNNEYYYDFHSGLQDLPKGTLAHLQYLGNNQWHFQIGEDKSGRTGEGPKTVLDLTFTALEAFVPSQYFKKPFEISGHGFLVFNAQDGEDASEENGIDFQIGEPLVKGQNDEFAAGTMQLTVYNTVYSRNNQTQSKQKTATYKFYTKDNEHMVTISVNGYVANWFLNGGMAEVVE